MTALRHQQPTTQLTPRRDVSRAAGVAFLVLFLVGFALLVTGPSIYEGGSAEQYAATYASGARETPVSLAAFVVLPLAAACLLWAVTHIARCLDNALGVLSLGGRVATLGAAVMAAGMTAAGAAAAAASHVASGSVPGFPADPATAYGLDMLASQVISISMWGASLVLVAVGISARHARVVPRWLLWAGIVVAPLLPMAFMFGMLPVLAFLLWLAVVGAMMRPAPVVIGR